jgi:predicted transcriptional regulator
LKRWSAEEKINDSNIDMQAQLKKEKEGENEQAFGEVVNNKDIVTLEGAKGPSVVQWREGSSQSI